MYSILQYKFYFNESFCKIGGRIVVHGLAFSKAAEASTRIDFLKSRRAQLMSDIQGEMQGNIFGTGVDKGKIKILQIEIDKLTEELNNLGEN